MKREILFKALRTDGKGWVEGQYYYDIDYGHIIIETRHDPGSHAPEPVAPYDYQKKLNVIPETVCQFTGLTDRNGDKIFEGDYLRRIVHCVSDDYIVSFEDFGFIITSVGHQKKHQSWLCSIVTQEDHNNLYFELTGKNIHDEKSQT